MSHIHINTHPIVQDRLTKIRNKDTESLHFRNYLNEIAFFLAVDATSQLPTKKVTVETPLQKSSGVTLKERSVIIPILRAGLALSEGLSLVLPDADTGHIGLYRDEETHRPVEYLVKLPDNLNRPIFVCDPMLATGHSMIKTLDILKEYGALMSKISIVTLLCAPEGIAELHKYYPDIPIFTAAVDCYLDDRAYIIPGLGDAGDRYFGT